ncbi:MAG: anthranilate synthase component I family protein [Gammaproteobacteria bacterium]|nr:anthranilate synthase component I family protein [Gammaproteobacteria bacterium]
MKFTVTELPYLQSTDNLLANLQALGGLVALESSDTKHENGRWSIITAKPTQTVSLQDKKELSSYLANLEKLKKVLPSINSHLPFTGGIIGHISYDLGLTDCKITPSINIPDQPLATCGLYTWAFLVDHLNKKSHLVHWSYISELEKTDLISIFECNLNSTLPFNLTTSIESSWSKETYKAKIARIHEYIKAGDCYQVNLAQTFTANYSGNTLNAYIKLRDTAKVPFASYFEDGNYHFASASPELFLEFNNDTVTTKPIKGTRPIKKDKNEDKQQIDNLKSSIKDRAENLMIVDLLRNDLSKNAKNIKVTKLFDVESFNTVHHLVSTITATADQNSLLNLLFDAFPGGSITGAPKKRAMEIIGELEEEPRSFYCGTTFYLSCNNHLNSNILIRGFLFNENTKEVKCWAGGGIVMDSNWEDEHQESLDKISKLIQAIS